MYVCRAALFTEVLTPPNYHGVWDIDVVVYIVLIYVFDVMCMLCSSVN
jgi:hypothetical protein